MPLVAVHFPCIVCPRAFFAFTFSVVQLDCGTLFQTNVRKGVYVYKFYCVLDSQGNHISTGGYKFQNTDI